MTNAAAQDYEHSQTRILEGVHEFFIRPVVAELQILSEKRIQKGPYNLFPGKSLDEISEAMLQNAKANAAYKAAQEFDADIILGTTFYVTNNKKKKGLDVIVCGYPAKYIKFHNYGDPKYSEDSKWIDPLLTGQRNRAWAWDRDNTQEASKAVQSNTK